MPASDLCIDVTADEMISWMKGRALKVAGDYGFEECSDEAGELIAFAFLKMVEFAHRYDETRLPDGIKIHNHFQGCFSLPLRKALGREALKLRNGGLFKTTALRAAHNLRCVGLPVDRDGDSDVIDPASVGG